MTQARKTVVAAGEVGVYHCISRCVRRAFLCGLDSYSGRNYEHRRGWVRDRIRSLSELFAVDVFAYAVMSNHLHIVLRVRPDLVCKWSDGEVGERWCRLFRSKASRERRESYDAEKLARLLDDPEALKQCRERLKDLSWFMRCLNEDLARRANAEDGCTGRFWEGRFKCQRLLDEGAMLACMAYVDLNPVRARMADGLEDSRFTSVYDRVVSKRAAARLEGLVDVENPSYLQQREIDRERERRKQDAWLLDFDSGESPFAGVDSEYYLSLVEWTGRNLREDKPGYIPVELEGLLERFALDAASWTENVARYGGLFYRVAGAAERLFDYARRRKQRWFRGQVGSLQLYAVDRETA